MKNYILLISVIIILTKFDIVSAQEVYIPPSPNNISMIKALDNDVNLYSGKANVHIPIYTVKEGSLSVDISLKYNGGSGIKVQEISGEAGLGWALIAGGVITRMSNNNLDNPNMGLLTSTDSLDFVNAIKVPNNKTDLDVFNSSIGGRIIYDINNKPHFMNEQGFKIEEDGIESPNRRWVIVSPNGDKYFFGETLASRERFVSTQGTTQSLSSLASAWHLSKIVSAKGEIIRFEYGKSNTLVQYTYWRLLRTKDSDNGYWINNITETKSPSEEIHLSKIITSQSTIEFLYTERDDVQNAKALSEIKVQDKNNILITKFTFETGYFSSADPTPTLRLKLNAVRQQGNTLDNTHLLASFEYNELEKLPARNSKKIDYWGYYNNNTTDKYFISEGANRAADFNKCKANILTGIRWPTGGTTQYTYELNSYRRNNTHYNGGGVRISSIKEIDGNEISKTTNYNYSTVFSGQNITSGLIHNWFDITNGYTADYSSKSNFLNGHLHTLSIEYALPIQKIIDLDGITIGYSKVTVTHADESNEEYHFQDYASFPDVVKFYTYTHLPFQAKVKELLVDSDVENYNGLNKVTSNSIQRGLISKKILRNSNNEMLKSIQYQYHTLIGVQIAGFVKLFLGSYNPDTHDLVNIESYNIGSLFNERVMSVRLVEIKEENFYPQDSGSVAHSISTIYEYKQFPWPFLLTKKTRQQSDGSELAVSYHYPSDMISLGKDNMGIYNNMVVKNMISPIIEETYLVDNKQMSFSRTNYDIFNFGSTSSLLLPKSIEVQNGSNPIETKALFNNYSSNGRLLDLTKLDNLNTAYLWGYNEQYLIAEVTNATYNDIAFTSFENGDAGNWIWNGTVLNGNGYEGKKYLSFPPMSVGSISKIGLNASKKYRVSFWAHNNGGNPGDGFTAVANKGDWTHYEKIFTGVTSFTYSAMDFMLDNISLCPVESFMSTFAYKPLVGMISRTDSRGVTEYYEYDGLGRLSVVKDFEGNILKTYCYNYAGQQVDCSEAGEGNPVDPNPPVDPPVLVIYDVSGKKIATITKGSANLDDYSFTSFEPVTYSSPSSGFTAHNFLFSHSVSQVSIDFWSGYRGLELYDANGGYIRTDSTLDPNKEYKCMYYHIPWSDWDGGWIWERIYFTGQTYFEAVFTEPTTIDDFMVFPALTEGYLHIYGEDDEELYTVPFF